MKPIERVRLADVLARYNDPFYQIKACGLEEEISVPAFVVVVRTLGAGAMPVDVYDADFGLQLFDPARSTPVGWIRPNPLRPGGTP